MQIHEIQPVHQGQTRKRRGRGGKKGTYSGRGMKGQKSRAGARFQPRIRELIKRYPKLRGYRARRAAVNISAINLSALESLFGDGEVITPQVLVEKNVVQKIKGRIPRVKILGRGDISHAVNVKDCIVSKTAREKIEQAGGSVN